MRQLIAIAIFILAVYLFISEWHLWQRIDYVELAIDTPQLRMFGGVVAWIIAGIIYQD